MHFKRFVAFLLVLVLTCGAFSALAAYNMPYYIEVDLTNQIVTIFNTRDNSIARQMLTSSGKNDCTPKGTFYMIDKGRVSERTPWTYFEHYECWVKYASRIYLGYMFHSLPFEKKDDSTMMQKELSEFGMPTSHGCMRLRVEDAKFIAENCLVGTRVTIYKDTAKKEDLRKLLYVSSYTGEDGMSYAEFLGYSADALGSGAHGVEVQDLQSRLTDLGYYDGPVSGKYDTDTITAVKKVQQDLGLAQNGITTPELQEVLFSDAAPVSAGTIHLGIGSSGPVVKKLQDALKTLGCYSGDLHGIFDVGVADAVRTFQSACGYKADGEASALLQQCIYHQLAQLEQTFGADSIPAVQVAAEEVTMASLNSINNIIIRSKPDTESANLGKLTNGEVMLVNGVSGDWASISTHGVTGYIMKKYLEPFQQQNLVLRYGESYTIGHTMAEYAAGEVSVANEFAAYLLSEQYTNSAVETVDYVTVNTGSDEVRLNLRAQPDSSAAVLAEVPNGTSLRALETVNGYTKVGFDEQIGYLLGDYLSYWQGGADEVVSTEQEDEETTALMLEASGETIQAVVIRGGQQDRVGVYKSGSADAERKGWIDVGALVKVISVKDGWALIEYKGKQGYMSDENLQFELLV